MNDDEIKLLPLRNVSVDQYLKIARRFASDPVAGKITREIVGNIPGGTFLGVYINKNGKGVRLYLKKIWIRPYSLKYRTTKTKNGKHRRGDEIIIASFPIPKVDL